MAPGEVDAIIDILLRYLPKEEVAMMLNDFRSVTIDKEYQAVLGKLEAGLAGRS